MGQARSSTRDAARPAVDLDYCRRLSVYLGLSLETVITLTRRGARAGAFARAAK